MNDLPVNPQPQFSHPIHGDTLHRIDLFVGEKVRLSQDDAPVLAENLGRWRRDSLYRRLLDDAPPSLFSTNALQGFIEKARESGQNAYFFSIHTCLDDRLIGFVALHFNRSMHRDCWLGIALGERSDWNKGYGSDALRLALRYAFDELDMHRVTLGVFANNRRAIRAYEKAGFVHEGAERGDIIRDGEREDSLVMGILRTEWEAAPWQTGAPCGGTDA